MPKLRVRTDRPVDSLVLAILQRTHAATRELAIDYFVGGALARDLILLHAFGHEAGRATRDVDLGIHINNWDVLDSLKAILIHGGNFSEQPGVAHRLVYRLNEDQRFGIPLDLLPFGGIERTDSTIAWPPDLAVVMNVAGFTEARDTAVWVEVVDDLLIPVASLPSLAAMKLIAWCDRHLETSKDATDFLVIARHYHLAGNTDRLYETESALLIAADYDPELAGASLLGKDVAAICSANTAQHVLHTVADDRMRQRLVDQLQRALLLEGSEAACSRVEGVLDSFRNGFELKR